MDFNTAAIGSSYHEIQGAPGQPGRGGNPNSSMRYIYIYKNTGAQQLSKAL